MYVYTGYVYTKLNSNRILGLFGVKNFDQAIKLVGSLPLFKFPGIIFLEGANSKEDRRGMNKSGAHFSINGT
jgi:hypothetical protein